MVYTRLIPVRCKIFRFRSDVASWKSTENVTKMCTKNILFSVSIEMRHIFKSVLIHVSFLSIVYKT